MSELIGRLVAHIGVHWAAAEKAVGISFNFLAKQGPSDKMRPVLASLPGAKALMCGVASKARSASVASWAAPRASGR
jgi:hypothetical protein